MAQGIGVVTGLQDRFNWTAVAASAVGAGAGTVAGQVAQGMGLGQIGTRFASGLAGGMTTASLGGGGVGTRQIVVNALGYSIVNSTGGPNQSETDLQRQEDMRDAAMFNALGCVPALGSGVSVRSDIWGNTASYGGYLPADLSLTAYGTPSLQRIEVTPEMPRTELDSDPDHTWNSAGELRGPTNTELPQAGLFDEVRNYWQEKKDSAVAGHNPAQYVGAHVMGVLGGAAEDITNAAKGLYSLATDRQTQINALNATQYAISHPDKAGNALINAGQRFIDKPFDEQADSALRFVAGGLATAGTGKAISVAGSLAYRGAAQSVQWLAPAIGDMAYGSLQRNGLILNVMPEGSGIISNLLPRVDVTDSFSAKLFKDGSRTYSYLDPENGHGLVMNVDKGILGFDIRAHGDVAILGSGRDMFISGMQRLHADSVQVNAIRGYWIEGSDSVNFQQYVENLKTMSPQQAAANTWTGRIARDFGYVNINQPKTSFGNTTVLFTK